MLQSIGRDFASTFNVFRNKILAIVPCSADCFTAWKQRWKVSPGSQSDRPPKDPLRSRITNGSTLLPGVDGRSAWVRRCKDVIAAHISDLGGVDNCSAAERSIIRRAAVLTTELEQLETRFALAGQADASDLETYQRCANTLRRLLECVGIARRPRLISPPTLSEIAAEIAAEKINAEDAEL